MRIPDAKVALSTASVYPESTATAFEIAARLGCTEGAARTRVHRGLARLNNLMRAEVTP